VIEFLASAIPWIYGMALFVALLLRRPKVEFETDSSSRYWMSFIMWSCLATVIVIECVFDAYGVVCEHIYALAAEDSFSTNPQSYQRMRELVFLRKCVQVSMWIISQILSPFITISLVRIADCTSWTNIAHLHPSLAAKNSGLDSKAKVMEIDPSVKCYEGGHLVIWCWTMALLCMFWVLVAPLLIACGNAEKLYRRTHDSKVKRLLYRANPKNYWQPKVTAQPLYTGPFARTREHYIFETAWVVYRMTVPVVRQMTTFFTDVQYLVEAMFGLGLLIVLIWRTPVQ